MCAHSLEGQLYHGLHQEKHDQHVEGRDSSPVLCSGETSPGLLCPVLKPSAQGHGAFGAGPEEGHKEERLRELIEVAQPGEEKAAGRPISSLPVPEESL